MRWAIFDSLYCAEQFPFSHLDSYATYLRLAGEEVVQVCWNGFDVDVRRDFDGSPDVSFFLDRYDMATSTAGKIKIAQVAARCWPMPWQVRGPGGARVFSLIVSSIPAMVEEAKAEGHAAVYQPLCFDLRARACMMGVKRERKAIFIGTRSPNHRRREEWLAELADVVEVVPPVFGRDYFRRIAGSTVLLQIHAEWSKGCANSMKMYEGPGAGAAIVADGQLVDDKDWWGWRCDTVAEARADIMDALEDDRAREQDERTVLATQTYEKRIPDLIRMVQEA